MQSIHRTGIEWLQVAVMERSLGKLSSAVRSKDAEIASLQNAMHEQFAERNGLRAQLSGMDSQLVRLQGSYGELEARLRVSEEERARLQAAQQRCATSCYPIPPSPLLSILRPVAY